MRNRLKNRALTLVELIASLAITASIGVVTTTVVVSMMNCRDAAEADYELTWSANIGLSRLETLISDSLLILQCNDTQLLLWTKDTANLGRVNLSELVFIEFNREDGTITQCTQSFPDGVSGSVIAAQNAAFSIGDVVNWKLDAGLLSGYPYMRRSELAVGVDSVKIVPDVSAPMSERVTISATFSNSAGTITLTGAAAVKRPVTDCVVFDNGIDKYLLTSEYDMLSYIR